jgi:F0F1-type ATP synthase epsilon subunit
MIYASMAEFKKGISIGTWGKGADGKMGIQPNQAPSNAAAAPAVAEVAKEAEEAEEEDI